MDKQIFFIGQSVMYKWDPPELRGTRYEVVDVRPFGCTFQYKLNDDRDYWYFDTDLLS